MNFKTFFYEAINYNEKIVIVPKGEVLYHGTGESFDTRTVHTGGYDEVFWTTDDMMIARTYIPSHSSYSMMSINNILKSPDNANIRKSLGLSNKIIELAWKKDHEGYQKLKYWDDLKRTFSKRANELEKSGDLDAFTDDFFKQWGEAENNYKKAMQEWRQADNYLKSFVIMKMKSFGYSPSGYDQSTFDKVLTDKDGNLLPAGKKSVGKVLKVICSRDFKMFNYAYQREGSLLEPDYYNLQLFRKIENKGYDGIIINDFAQSDYHGNLMHRSVGFFQKALKDLTIKPIRSQTHPEDKEWQ